MKAMAKLMISDEEIRDFLQDFQDKTGISGFLETGMESRKIHVDLGHTERTPFCIDGLMSKEEILDALSIGYSTLRVAVSEYEDNPPPGTFTMADALRFFRSIRGHEYVVYFHGVRAYFGRLSGDTIVGASLPHFQWRGETYWTEETFLKHTLSIVDNTRIHERFCCLVRGAVTLRMIEIGSRDKSVADQLGRAGSYELRGVSPAPVADKKKCILCEDGFGDYKCLDCTSPTRDNRILDIMSFFARAMGYDPVPVILPIERSERNGKFRIAIRIKSGITPVMCVRSLSLDLEGFVNALQALLPSEGAVWCEGVESTMSYANAILDTIEYAHTVFGKSMCPYERSAT